MPVKYEITGTLRSNIKINKITGWPIEVRSLQLMKGDIEILDNSKVPGGMKIPVSLKTVATTTSN
nr:hypothetical protein [Mucilaginibacter sp. X5P1]